MNRGFGYFCTRLVRRYFSDNVTQSAAELSYFLLFSVFPFLMFLNGLLSAFGVSSAHLEPALELMPRSVSAIMVQYFEYLGGLPSASPMIIGISLTIYFISRVIRSLMRTVNRIFRVETERSAIMEFALSVLFTAGFLLALLLSLVALIIGRSLMRLVLEWVPFISYDRIFGIRNTGYLALTVFLFLFLLVFNRVVPNVHLKWREAAPGALFSLAAWLLISVGFSFYVDNLANYTVLYGSIGAIIAMMLWLYLISVIMILGPLVNHILLVMRALKRT